MKSPVGIGSAQGISFSIRLDAERLFSAAPIFATMPRKAAGLRHPSSGDSPLSKRKCERATATERRCLSQSGARALVHWSRQNSADRSSMSGNERRRKGVPNHHRDSAFASCMRKLIFLGKALE